MDVEFEHVVDRVCDCDCAVLLCGDAVFQAEGLVCFFAGVVGDVLEVAVRVCDL